MDGRSALVVACKVGSRHDVFSAGGLHNDTENWQVVKR